MGKPTLRDKINQIIGSIEYYFAKKWLDKTFGEQEYWGDYIQGLILFKQSAQKREEER